MNNNTPKISALCYDKRMSIKNTLKQLGLSDRHASIYLACLELGSSTIPQISDKSGFARSTCEAVLNSLQEKGFVTSFKSKNIKKFSPEDPKRLLEIQQDKLKLLENSLPQLKARYFKGGILPTVRLYEGEQSVKNVFNEILDEAKEMISYGSIDDVYDSLGDYFPKFTKERIKRKIPLKVILKKTELAKQRQELGIQELRKVKILPSKYNSSSLIIVWGEKIAMFELKEKITVFVIESEELSNTQKTMFDFMWNRLL